MNLNIVMEYASAGNLKTRIDEKKNCDTKFDESEVLNIVIQILLALKYCHA